VTEAVSGVDIVAAQFEIAAGRSIDHLERHDHGYAMELRINAERAEIGEGGSLTFLPCPGQVTAFHFPEAEGITLIRAVDAGKMVTPYYDSMIVQLIGHAPTRADVIRLLREYLDTVEVRGISTNIPLLRAILDDAVFQSNDYDTTFLREFTRRIDTAQLIAAMDAAAGTGAGALDLEALTIAGTSEIRVLAPSAGIFYRTPSPGEPDFVRPGDVVNVERTLCLLEAMKLFRPLTLASYQVYPSDRLYEIVRIVPDSGQTVNREDLLFIVRPVADSGSSRES
jgi:biotin carboxyl carrier protein